LENLFLYISVFWVFFLQILEWMCMVFLTDWLSCFSCFWQKQCFLCIAYGQYPNMFWMFFFYIKKIYWKFSKMCLRMDFLNTTKLFSCISGFYNMFVKLQRVLANIPKNYKNLILWGIHLLFTVNVWIKKSQRNEYPKYYWE